MRILYRNLNILDIMCDGRDNTKERCSCISIVVPSKTEWLGKKEKTAQRMLQGFLLPIACSSKMRNFKQNKEDKIFS